MTVGGTGLYSNADLTFASITPTTTATVNFVGSTLGGGGSNPRILFTNASGLNYSSTTGVIGSWAIANSDTFAAYNPSLGVGAVGTDGYQGYAGGSMTGGTVTTVNNVNIYAGGTLTGFGVGNVTDLFDGVVGVNNALTLALRRGEHRLLASGRRCRDRHPVHQFRNRHAEHQPGWPDPQQQRDGFVHDRQRHGARRA